MAMVLAAGRGERLRPITDTIPKPLVVVGGKTMLDRMLDAVAAAGVAEAVVNTHHLADAVAARLKGRSAPRITLSHEEELLETGGGVAKALPILTAGGAAPFFVANSDIVLIDGARPALTRLAEAWRGDHMDALLLVHPTARAHGYAGRGDFHLAPNGQLTRRDPRETAPTLFTGTQILHPRLFAAAPPGPFSLNILYDRAQASGRLHGLRHDGQWLHIGTPEALRDAETTLARLV